MISFGLFYEYCFEIVIQLSFLRRFGKTNNPAKGGIHLSFAERGGLLSVIPGGYLATINYSLIRFTHKVFLFSDCLIHPSLIRQSENKNPPASLRE
jgi:hypothetical protein